MTITQNKRVSEGEFFIKWLIPNIYLAEVGLPEEENANEITLGYLNLIKNMCKPEAWELNLAT